MKKTVTLVLSLVLIAALLVGCGGSKKEAEQAAAGAFIEMLKEKT